MKMVFMKFNNDTWQIEEFQELMNQITKAHTADLEAIQKTQRVRNFFV